MLQFCELDARNGNEAHAVSDGEQAHFVSIGAKHLQRSSAEKSPAAWSRDGINAGVIRSDADAASGDTLAWSRKPRRDEFLCQFAEVGKSGDKTEEVDEVMPARVQFDDALGGKSVQLRDVVQVRPKFAAVADGDFDVAQRRKDGAIHALDTAAKRFLERLVTNFQGIEFHEHRTVRRMEIANAADRLQFQEADKSPHVFVDCEADLIAKRNQQGLVAGDLESRFGG